METSPERRTCYSDLGIPEGASRKEIERAFWDRQRQGGEAAGGPEALQRAERAYLTLSDPERRRMYDRRLGKARHPAWDQSAPMAARETFGRCLQLMARKEHGRALRMAKRAVSLDPACPLYRSCMALLMARTGASVQEALRQGRAAWEQDPRDRRIALNLAALYETAGMRKRARSLRRRWKRGLLSAFLGRH